MDKKKIIQHKANKKLLFFLLFSLTIFYSYYDQLIQNYYGNFDIERIYLTTSFIFALVLVYFTLDIKIKLFQTVSVVRKVSSRRQLIAWLILISISLYGMQYAVHLTYDLGWFNRAVRENVDFYSSGEWAILKMLLISSYVVILFYSKDNTKQMLFNAALAILVVAIVEVALLGGRRLVVSMFIPAVFILVKDFKFKHLMYIFIFFVLMFLFGGLREYVFHSMSVTGSNDLINSILLSNEFQYVSSGMAWYLDLVNKDGIQYGASYAKVFYYFLSLFGIGEVISAGRESGFFISIFSEAVLNYHWLAFIPFIIFIFIYARLVRNLNKIHSLVLLTLLIELFRTSFLEFVLSAILIYSFSYLIISLIRLQNILRRNFLYRG